MKQKKIDVKNLQMQIGISQIVSFWFLWDKFTQEWVRTVLVLVYALLVILVIVQAATTEHVDIFENK